MGSPSSPPLTVEESDGTNSNRPVTDLKFNAADFTIAASGRSSTVSLSGSGSGASLTDTFVGFGDASNLLTGSAKLIWNDTTERLTIDGGIFFKDPAGADDSEIYDDGNYLKIFGQESLAFYANNNLNLSITPGSVTNHRVTYITKSVSGAVFEALRLTNSSNDAGSDVMFQMYSSAGTDSNFEMVHDSFGVTKFSSKQPTTGTIENFRIGNSGTIFNDGGDAAMDFRVESDSYQEMFFIDAGLNKAHFGTGGIVNTLGLVQINVGNSTQNALTVSSTDGDAAQSPTIEFYRNSASPADEDKLGQLNFTGNNANGDKVIYAQMYAQIDKPTTGSHDGRLVIDVVSNAASPINVFRADKDEIIINDASFALTTRIESNGNANMFVIDGSSDTVGIGGIAQSDSTVTIYDTNDQDVLLRLETDENSADKSPALEFYKNSAADISDYIMAIDSYGLDDGAAKSHYSRIATYIEDETAATENAVILFQVADAGSLRSNLVVGSTLVTINANQRNVDFRVLADDGSKNIYSDAGINAVGIQEQPTTGLADNNPVLQVNGSISSKCAILTRTSATVDLSTRVSNELIGQLYVLTSASAKTLTVPTSCNQGDWFRVLTTGANGMDIVSTGGATLNGSTPNSLNRDTENEIYTVVAIATNKWICTSN